MKTYISRKVCTRKSIGVSFTVKTAKYPAIEGGILIYSYNRILVINQGTN
jgi:hypothetical protein